MGTPRLAAGRSMPASVPKALSPDIRDHPWEWLLAVALVGALINSYFQFLQIGYLPLPFWPDPTDVYADGYSTTWWAYNGHMYDIWKSVYPPLSFVITRFLSDARCYNADVTFARDCDWLLWSWMLTFYIANIFIVFISYRRAGNGAVVPRTLGVAFGLPMLYSFEHLNLLVISYTGLFIAFGNVIYSSRARWLGLAVAINLKVYLIVVLLGQLLKRRWRWVEGCLLLTIAVGVIAFAILGHGTPSEIYRNIITFSSDPDRASSWYFVFYASSYVSMVEFFHSLFRLMPLVGSWKLEFWGTVLTVLVRLVQLASLAAFVAIWLRPQAVSRTRIAAMCYLLILISNETGGYTTAGAIFLTFFEPWRGAARIIAIVSAYLLCLAVDVDVVPIGGYVTQGYFAGRPVWQDLWLSAGPFIRPGLIITVQLGLIAATFTDARRFKAASSGILA